MTNGEGQSRVPTGSLPASPAQTTPSSKVSPGQAVSPSTSEVELQRIMLMQAGSPATPINRPIARTATPALPSEQRSKPTAMTQAVGGAFSERVKAFIAEKIEEVFRSVRDQIAGLNDQITALSARMDEAGQKDDAHDGDLEGLKKGLKDAEAAIKDVESKAEIAQKAADAVSERLDHELGGL